MLRAMLFIDLSWLSINARSIANTPDFKFSYAGLPQLIRREVARLTGYDVYIPKIHAFVGHPAGYDTQDNEIVDRRWDFIQMLQTRFGYEIHAFDQDYQGQRIVKSERPDGVQIKEKQVDVAMAVEIVNQAALNTYDVAVIVAGDLDFAPAMKSIRERYSKKVVLVSIQGRCSRILSDPNDQMGLKDYPVLWLNDYASELEYGVVTPFKLEDFVIKRG